MAEYPEFVVNLPVLARVLGRSLRHTARLVREGVLPRHSPRRYELGAAVRAFIAYVEAGHEGSGVLADAKLRTEQQRARQLALMNGQREGALLPLEQMLGLL